MSNYGQMQKKPHKSNTIFSATLAQHFTPNTVYLREIEVTSFKTHLSRIKSSEHILFLLLEYWEELKFLFKKECTLE